MNDQEKKTLDFSSLNFKNDRIPSSQALKDVVPFQWSKEVKSGEKQAIISKQE